MRRSLFAAVLLAMLPAPALAEVHSLGPGLRNAPAGVLSPSEPRSPQQPARLPVRLDADALLAADGSDAFQLPSTGWLPLHADDVHVRRRADGLYSWTGRIDTRFGPQTAVLTFRYRGLDGADPIAFGLIPQYDGPPLRLETRRGRMSLVEGPQTLPDFAVDEPDFRRPPAPDARQRELRRRQDEAKAAGDPVIDVLVVYTPALVQVWGSNAAVQTRIAYLEDITNQAYVDSDVDQSIRVVGTQLVDYAINNDNDDALDAITGSVAGSSDSLPVRQEVVRLRALYGADLVKLMRNFDRSTQNSCGVGWLGGWSGNPFHRNWGYSVTSDHGFANDNCGEWTYAHELGHNMGSHHDMETAEGEAGAFAYSHGLRETLSPTSGFATIMAYTGGPQVRVGRFSNPRQIECLGQACGDAATADNARSLNQTGDAVAAFVPPRPTSGPPALSVSDVTVTEGNSGQKDARFIFTLSAPATSAVSISTTTMHGDANAADYVAQAAMLTIPAGQTTGVLDIKVRGDTVVERDEIFAMNILSATNARIVDGQGIGTIVNDEATPTLSVADVALDEGNAGDRQASFTVSLTAPSTAAVTFAFHTHEYAAGPTAAVAGVDFEFAEYANVTIPAGQTSVQVAVPVHGDTLAEQDERFYVMINDVVGAVVGDVIATGRILDDDTGAGPLPPFATRPDRFRNPVNFYANWLPIRNDVFDADRLRGGSLTIVDVREGSTAVVFGNADPGSPVDDSIRVFPREDFIGEERVRYRLCEGTPDARCVQGDLVVVFNTTDFLDGTSGSGYLDGYVESRNATPARYIGAYSATPLVAPEVSTPTLVPDTTPESPWDGARTGTSTIVRTLLATPGQPLDWRLLVDSALVNEAVGERWVVDLYVGIDSDGGNDADQSEVVCASANDYYERCEVPLHYDGSAPVRYWVLVHNRGTMVHEARLDVYEVPMIASDGDVTVTGPGILDTAEDDLLRVSWKDLRMVADDRRAAFVGLRAFPDAPLSYVPLRIIGAATQPPVTALASGESIEVALGVATAGERIFIDVPPGATRLEVEMTSAQEVDLYLARSDTDDAGPWVNSAPPRNRATAVHTGPGGNATLIVTGAQLQTGRWYVTPVNAGTVTATVGLRATLVAPATPVVRPGSYFDPARSGHGVFLYPAGGDWVGLWFTYLQNRSPTWYYLQGAKPGANGIWEGGLYRAMWDGDSNALTKVGRVLVTPTAADAFRFTFELDGETGSEPMIVLGRGCPTLSGTPLDVSSHWFNPATAGSGHSVQMFPDYEFYASFVYDAFGQPRFLVAESTTFVGASATIPIAQLQGFCPLCVRTGAPLRTTVGTLTRSFGGGTFTSLGVQATFAGTVEGTWNQTEPVQLLGGPPSTQGCLP